MLYLDIRINDVRPFEIDFSACRKSQVFSRSKLETLRRELAQSIKGIRLRAEGIFWRILNLQPLNQR